MTKMGESQDLIMSKFQKWDSQEKFITYYIDNYTIPMHTLKSSQNIFSQLSTIFSQKKLNIKYFVMILVYA